MVNLEDEGEEKNVKIEAGMTKEMKLQVYTLLKEFKDIIAWSYKDMPGSDPEIVQHRLPLKPECHPIKQRLRRMKPEVSLNFIVEKKWKNSLMLDF